MHSFPQSTHIFKTLKPDSNSISPKFNPNSGRKPILGSSNRLTKQIGYPHFHQVSDLDMLQVNDQSKTLNQGLSPIPRKVNLSCENDVVVVEGIDSRKTQKKNGGKMVVIEVKDDEFDYNYDDDDDDDDDECVFVKKEKNLTPRGKNKKDPICVDDYVKESNASIDVDKVVHCVDDYDDNDEVRIIRVKHVVNRRRNCFNGVSIIELGESSGTKNKRNDDIVIEIDDFPVEKELMFLCEICADSKRRKESFTIKGCSHSYCSDCMKNYVASKLQDGVPRVSCPVPNCGGVLEPEYCREILPFEVFERWGNLLCESVILASQKFYCPFKDCSALLLDDGSENVTQSECPSCFRLFCAQCKVGWHDAIPCAEYQKLSKDERQKEDIMLRNLAKTQKWQRCPVCKFYVEKSEGCLYMKCRCGVAFCYSCGAVNTDHRYHYCIKCGR